MHTQSYNCVDERTFDLGDEEGRHGEDVDGVEGGVPL